MIVVGVMRQRLDRDEIPGIDLDHRRQRPAEIAPVHGVDGGGQVMVAGGPVAHSGITGSVSMREESSTTVRLRNNMQPPSATIRRGSGRSHISAASRQNSSRLSRNSACDYQRVRTSTAAMQGRHQSVGNLADRAAGRALR